MYLLWIFPQTGPARAIYLSVLPGKDLFDLLHPEHRNSKSDRFYLYYLNKCHEKAAPYSMEIGLFKKLDSKVYDLLQFLNNISKES